MPSNRVTGRADRSVTDPSRSCKPRYIYRPVSYTHLDVYKRQVDEYAYLHECGVDYVTVFQETYDDQKYKTLHLGGHKRIFPYRLNAQERALMGGMRGVGFAALLGLSDFRKDAFATGLHAYLLQRKYPVSYTHLIGLSGDVSRLTFAKAICQITGRDTSPDVSGYSGSYRTWADAPSSVVTEVSHEHDFIMDSDRNEYWI